MELTLHELAFIDNAVFHFQTAVAMVPALFVLALILVTQPGRHVSYNYYQSQPNITLSLLPSIPCFVG